MPNERKPTLIWTALPNGIEPNPLNPQQLQLSVFISPRLYGEHDMHISDFDWLKDWPEFLRKLRFMVEISGQAPVAAELVSLEKDSSRYWAALFPEKRLVRPYGEKQSETYINKNWQSYPVRSTLTYIKQQYQKIANLSPISLPSLDFKIWKDLLLDLSQNYHEGTKRDDFLQLRAFYNRPSSSKPFKIELPCFDFHELVSALGDHPVALRKLGLVIDLLFPAPAFVQKSGMIRIRLDPEEPPFDAFCPWTHYIVSKHFFQAEPRKIIADVPPGYLDLKYVDDTLEGHHPFYDLVQVDPDGAALKIINLADSRPNMKENFQFEEPKEEGLPALRSAGFELTRFGRVDAVKARLSSDIDKESLISSKPEALEFYAEDVLRGYRIDILDTDALTPQWRSLCQRTGEIVVPSPPNENLAPLVVKSEEGYVKGASTASSGPGEKNVYLHESMFRWEGWSMVVPRPGLASASATERLDRSANHAHPDFPFEAHYHVPDQSLPALRFGHRYRMRVRMVDLAGNSIQFDPQNSQEGLSCATAPIPYRRFEPIKAPVLVPRNKFLPGESLMTLVIRSNYNQSVTEWAATHPEQNSPITCERHILPPRASANLVETHSMLDDFLLKGNAKAAYNILLRESGDLRMDEIVNIATGEIENAGAIIEPTENGSVIHREQDLKVPYLPDPAALGACFFVDVEHQGKKPVEWLWRSNPNYAFQHLDSGMGKIFGSILHVEVPYRDRWPSKIPFRLVLKEQKAGCNPWFAWDDERALTVCLDKGQVLPLCCSSTIDKSTLEQLGILQWLREVANPHFDCELAPFGLLWMLTPYHRLTLVHAVQQPLLEPQLEKPIIAKESLGATYVKFQTDLLQHTASTAKIELLAKWSDPVDNPKKSEVPVDNNGLVITQERDQQVLEFPVAPNFPNQLALGGEPSIGYLVPPGKEVVHHELGDTKHRWVEYRLRAATRFREYFSPSPLETKTTPQYELDNFTRSGAVQRLNVLNSAPPPVPSVAYIVPTFEWLGPEANHSQSFTRTRVGGGLRIYLDRPWYESGEGELLGIILLPSADKISKNLEKLVTQFGRDPMWDSTLVDPHLVPGDFHVPVRTIVPWSQIITEHGLSLRETSPATVDVVGFVPQFNREQDRWYVDIQINEDKLQSYYPFLRLALARYQPDSLAAAKLSPVVLTDMVQLVPTRTLTFIRQSAKATVRLEGYQPLFSQLAAWAGQVSIRLESFQGDRADANDPLGWVNVSSDIVGNPVFQPVRTPFINNPYYLNVEAKLDHIPILSIRGTPPHRLVIEEREMYSASEDTGRIVYLDTINLNF